MTSNNNPPFEQFEYDPTCPPSFSQAADLYLAYIRVERGLSKQTVYSYAAWLHHFQRWLEENGYPSPALSAFNSNVLTRFLHTLHSRNLRPRSIRGVFYPLRGMGDYLTAKGLLDANPARSVTLPKKDAAIRQIVTDTEVANLLDAASRIRGQRRATLARAVLSVFIYAGLRRSETIALHLSDVSVEDSALLVRSGKGAKSRRVFPHPECIAAIGEWLAFRPKAAPHDFLFIGGQYRPLGEKALVSLLDEVKCIAGYRGERRMCLHALRHNCATRLLRNGADVGQIQVFLGHTSLMTTQMYLHTTEENIRGIAHLTAINHSDNGASTKSRFYDSPTPGKLSSDERREYRTARRSTPTRR